MSSECAASKRDARQGCWLFSVEDRALAKKNYSALFRESSRILPHCTSGPVIRKRSSASGVEWCCPQHGTCGVKWQEGRFQVGDPCVCVGGR